jgi:hypothetical protein
MKQQPLANTHTYTYLHTYLYKNKAHQSLGWIKTVHCSGPNKITQHFSPYVLQVSSLELKSFYDRSNITRPFYKQL